MASLRDREEILMTGEELFRRPDLGPSSPGSQPACHPCS
jgi:hypothetical protein